MRAFDRRVELDVLAQVEAVGDIVHPALDLRLAGELLAPAPPLVQILGKQVLVDIAFRVEACAGIPVPIPGSADVRRGVERLHRQSLAAQKMQLIKARDAGADHGRVQLQGRVGIAYHLFDCGGDGHRFISLWFRWRLPRRPRFRSGACNRHEPRVERLRIERRLILHCSILLRRRPRRPRRGQPVVVLRYSAGVTPSRRRKRRVIWLWSEKPLLAATTLSGVFPLASWAFARSMRLRMT